MRDFIRTAWSSPEETRNNHIEEFITLVYAPSKEFHDFPPGEITLGQKTSRDNGHQLDSMRFFGVIVRCRPSAFQTSGEQRYEEWLLQKVENEMSVHWHRAQSQHRLTFNRPKQSPLGSEVTLSERYVLSTSKDRSSDQNASEPSFGLICVGVRPYRIITRQYRCGCLSMTGHSSSNL